MNTFNSKKIENIVRILSLSLREELVARFYIQFWNRKVYLFKQLLKIVELKIVNDADNNDLMLQIC